MRELIYYVATSLDGFIAGDGGDISGFLWDDAFGAHLMDEYPETFPVHLRGDGYTKDDNKMFDAVLMGRGTYDLGLKAGIASPYPTMDQYVFSRSFEESPDDDVTVVSENATDVVAGLKQADGRAIWLCGGGALATTLHTAGLIDRLIIKLNPILFGSGIGLFRQPIDRTELTLERYVPFDSGHVILHYKVTK